MKTLEGPRDRERLPTVVVPDYDDLAALIGDRIVEVVRREVAARGRCVFGLATGSTPLGIYRELIARHRRCPVPRSAGLPDWPGPQATHWRG